MTPAAKTQLVQTLAREVGFDLVGVTSPKPVRRIAYYRQWLAAGYSGTMTYLARNVQVRAAPARLLAGARSVICVAVNYRRADGYLGPTQAVPPDADTGEPTGRIAQYARGYDYHDVLRRMMSNLVGRMRECLSEAFAARVCVDTAPILEKELAAAAGLGWIGKNTCLLNAGLGSYFVLGEIVATLDLATGRSPPDRCGQCTRCLDACPTQALIGPHRMDASRCVSYLTIEHRGTVAAGLHAAIGDRLVGCDVCQQVCPYNARAPVGCHPEITADVLPARFKLLPLINLREDEYRQLIRRSAARRLNSAMWRRNAEIVLGNLGGPSKLSSDTIQGG